MDFHFWNTLSELGKTNSIAKELLHNWSRYQRKELKEEELIDILRNPAPYSASGDYDDMHEAQWVDMDLRIKNLYVEGFRGIPPSEKKIKTGYGLDFTCNSDCEDSCSAIFLGSNGSGKTSLYSAIELVCKGYIATAKKHSLEGDADKRKFYHYFGKTDIGMEIALEFVGSRMVSVRDNATEGKDMNFSIPPHIDLSPFFCSESDLSMFECSGRSIVTYVDEVIGLTNFTDAAIIMGKLLDALADNYKTESEEFEKSEEDSEKHKTRLDTIQSKMDMTRQLADALALTRQRVSINFLANAQKIIETLMGDFIKDGNDLVYSDDRVELAYEEKPDPINEMKSVRIFTGELRLIRNSKVTIEPRFYFNNFRFKLYLVCLRIAIAFYVMKVRKISFPLIFDDIFDSSDFPNRLKTDRVFRNIHSLYRDMEVRPEPLQMIFFTQDEVIAESVFNGLTELREENDKTDYDSGLVFLARIFNHTEVDESDLRKFSCSDDNCCNESLTGQGGEELLAQSDGRHYYNLFDNIIAKPFVKIIPESR